MLLLLCEAALRKVPARHGTAQRRHGGRSTNSPRLWTPRSSGQQKAFVFDTLSFIINKHLPCSSKSYKKAANAKALIFWPRPRLMCYIICLDYGKNLGKQKSGFLIFSMTVPPLSCNYNMLFEIIVTRFCVTPLLMRYLT